MGKFDWKIAAGWPKKWKAFFRRRRMRRLAVLLVAAREVKPELLRYLEGLELQSESQAKELKMLRWAHSCEQFADLDQELDRKDWYSGTDASPE